MASSGAGPLGGDHLRLHLTVEAGAVLSVGSVAAGVALPGAIRAAGGSEAAIEVNIGRRGVLSWRPEPLVVAEGAMHRSRATLRLADGARIEWREILVLGRHNESTGEVRSSLWADVADTPLLRHELHLGCAPTTAWNGPAGIGEARVVGSMLLAGNHAALAHGQAEASCFHDDVTVGVLDLEGPGVLVVALGNRVGAVTNALESWPAGIKG